MIGTDRREAGRDEDRQRKRCRSGAAVVESSIARTTVLGTSSVATWRGYLSCRSRLLASRERKKEVKETEMARRERKVGPFH